MSPQQNPYRFVDRIPADAERIIHLGDGRALAEAFALLNPDCRWEDWSAARDLPPGSVDAVVI